MSEIVRSVDYDQANILRGIIKLHCPDGFDCDVTYGNGSFYKDVPAPRLKFDIDPQQTGGAEQACSTNLPLANGSVRSIVFDPPFLTYVRTGRTGNGQMVMAKRFAGYWKYAELETHYQGTLAEAFRVLVPEGVLVFKCQDIIHNHKMHCTHAKVIQWAELTGFRLLDLYVLAAKHRLPAPNRSGTQKHARIFHSYFLVFQRSKKPLDTTQAPQYNSSTVTEEHTMNEAITLEGTVSHDNQLLARTIVGEDMTAEQTQHVVENSAPQIPVDKLVKIYVKMRDALSEKKRAFDAVEKDLKTQMATVATELKARAQLEGVDGFKTEFGTVYLSETLKTSCADWSAFGAFLKDHDPLEFMEKRISSTAVKEYMKHNDGQLPPGVSIFKEIEARVRRAGDK